jgi:hypothetical protein
MAQRQRSLAPLTGVVFVVLLVAAFITGGETPAVDDSAEEVVSFYQDNEAKVVIGSLLFGLGAVLFLFFTGVLRRVLRSAEGPTDWLSAVAFGGGVVAAVGMLIFAGLGFTLSDAADDLPPAAMQTLNALSFDLFLPLAGGMVTLLVATGLSALKTKVLPQWLAWAALVLAVAGFTPVGFFAFLATILWVLVVSILLWRAGATPAPATESPAL